MNEIAENPFVRIQSANFSVDAEILRIQKTVQNPQKIGGIASFVGCVRDFAKEGSVQTMHLEAYEKMAVAEMQSLQQEAIHRFSLIAASLIHRTGNLLPGDQIVLIIAAASHRKEAFAACSWLIDELKARVPIWKKEISPSGEIWVSPHP